VSKPFLNITFQFIKRKGLITNNISILKNRTTIILEHNPINLNIQHPKSQKLKLKVKHPYWINPKVVILKMTKSQCPIKQLDNGNERHMPNRITTIRVESNK